MPYSEPTPIPNVGQFNTPGYLPGNPGPPDPLPTPGSYYPPGAGLDYWTRIDPGMGYIDPTLTVYPANPADAPTTSTPETRYPAPGRAPQAVQSIMSRLFNNIPAVRIARTVSGLFNRNIAPGWQNNAASNPVQGVVPVPVGGAIFGYNPSSGGGGGTPRWNYGTGQLGQTPSTNPLYNTGNGWAPVSGAGTDIRWAPNSGTGNFQADQYTNAYQLNQPGGGPNRLSVSDSGQDRYSLYPGTPRGHYDPETGRIEEVPGVPIGAQMQQYVYPSQSESARLGLSFDTNAWNAWMIAHNPQMNRNANQLPPATFSGNISGPPPIPIG